jgi:hypothetical protein
MPDPTSGLMTIVGEALELTDPTARSAYLDCACRGDDALRQRVETLLAAHAGAGRFLEPDAAGAFDATSPGPTGSTGTFAPDPPPAGASPTADYPGRDERAGAVIGGKYTLVEAIGEGGMGSVWRAKQTEPVKRFVAVKLIKAGMDSRQVLARFDAERQALIAGLPGAPGIATLEAAVQATPVTLYSAEAEGPVATTFEAIAVAGKSIVGGKAKPTPTNEARAYLNSKGIPFTIAPAKANESLVMQIGDKTVTGFATASDKAANAASKKAYDEAIAGTGYTQMTVKHPLGGNAADESKMNKFMLVVVLTILMIYVTMVYGPIAAQLVELFPTRIRYTSMSLPYHIGNGWFGGFLPFIATSIVVFTGNIYAGLWYPIAIALMTLIVGWIFLPETKDVDITKT